MSQDTPDLLRRNVATPERLPVNHDPEVARAYMNEYARLQILKLKVTAVLLAAVVLHWCLS